MYTKRLSILLLTLLLAVATSAHAAPGTSPTTGLPTDKPYRPVLVQVSNSREARPLYGFAKADVVYESVYWGPAHTRYLLLFNDEHPEVAGSLRSTRVFWNELREMWDCPFVFWGRQGKITDRINRTQFFDEHEVPETMLFDGTYSAFAGLMFRTKDRIAPHNAVVNLQALVADHWPTDEGGQPYEPALPNMRFSDTPSRGEETANTIEVTYEARDYAARYVYDAATRHYIRWYDGMPQRDDAGTPVTAANVIIQYVWLSFFNSNYSLPIVKTTGSGPMDAFIDGTHIRGAWVRDEVDAWIRYLDSEGKELTLLPGKTFVQMVPMAMTIDFTDESGTTRTLSAATQDDQ